jgi:uncharacterized iron-regulated protein
MVAQYNLAMRRFLIVIFVFACAHAPPAKDDDLVKEPHGAHGADRPIPLPYHLVDGATGQPLDGAAFDDKLRAARVIYVGEEHSNPHHHAAEIEVLERVAKLDPSLALGLEMLPGTLQAPLDQYVAGVVGEDKFLDAVDWSNTWGYPWGFYAPLVAYCRDHKLQAVALNAPLTLAHAVAKKGLDGLSAEEKQQLPQMQMGPEAHRERVREAFGAHPHGKFSKDQFERFYAAQLVWDETMATRVAATLSAAGAPHHMVVVAGEGHTERDAVPDRAARRGATPYLVIVPLFEADLADAVKDHAADVLWVFDTK